MNEWTRQAYLEDAYAEMYGIKPQVFYLRLDRNEYKIKLVLADKEIILREKMKDGLTNEVDLEFNGVTKGFTKYSEAEKEATAILKG